MALNRDAGHRCRRRSSSRAARSKPAIKEYRKLLAENPNDTSTLNRLGDLYARIDRIDEAVRLFSQIADRYTDDGFFVKAIAIYKKIIKLDPTRLAVYERLAELYHKQGLIPRGAHPVPGAGRLLPEARQRGLGDRRAAEDGDPDPGRSGAARQAGGALPRAAADREGAGRVPR